MTEYTAAAYAAHNKIANGTSYDPRDPAYGAICGGYNTFTGNGSTTTFSYTIPFTGSSPTDNSNFMVFYEPTNGTGSATVLNTSQFTVTGVNSGTGGTITLNVAPPSGNTLIVAHDDSAGLLAASTAAVATGGYVVVPDGCTIYGSQSSGTQLTEGAQLIGQGFLQNYGFQGQGTKPILRVIAPTGAAPAFGINISGKNQQFFEGFEITTNVPGANSLGFLAVPVLIGANGSSGAGGGQSPGIVAQYMTFNSGIVGFGAPIGGNSGYIFAVVRFSNFTANSAGIYGPLSDQQIIGNNFNSNGAFGTYGSAGGMVIGPQEGAPGASSAGRIEFNRFEFNSEGVVIKSGSTINFDGNQFDANSFCGLDLNTFWSDINITGGWFRGNANGGGSYSGSTTAGKDAHICFNGGTGSTGLHLANVNFYTNYSEGNTAPLGSPNATTPPYVLDFNTAGTTNEDVEIVGGDAKSEPGNNGAAVTDFDVYRNGMPRFLRIDIVGQAISGKNANGLNPSLVRGIPALQAGTVIAFGDHNTLAPNTPPPGTDYGTLISGDMNAGYTNKGQDQTFTCDSIDLGNGFAQQPGNTGNPLYLFLPSNGDVNYGAGNVPHETDVHNCNRALLSWLGVPAQFKTVAQNASCVQAGTWANDSSFGGTIGVKSDTNGSTLTCTFTSYGKPVYAWYKVHDSDGGTFTYQLDSNAAVSVNTGSVNPPTGDGSGDAFSESLIRIPFTPSGTHTLTFTVTSSTSSSNNVYILGVGTPPNVSYYGGGPTLFEAGMPYLQNDAFSSFGQTYDQMFRADVASFKNDGLNVNFVDIRQYMNSTTDLASTLNLAISGEQHIRDAFEGQIQYVKNPSSSVIDPRNYGAVCNTQYFDGRNGSGVLSTTASSPVISISGYTFSPTDVNSTISINNGASGTLGVDTGTIVSVDTNANTATLSVTPNATTSSGYAVFGHDDTAAFTAASQVSATTGITMVVPYHCGVRNWTPSNASNTTGFMSNLGYNYTPDVQPILYILETGYAEDTYHYGINLGNGAYSIALSGFGVKGVVFPYLAHASQANDGVMACIGTATGTDGYSDGIIIDKMTIQSCPVGFGVAYGATPTAHIFGQGHGNQFANNGYGMYGAFSDWQDIGSTFSGNFHGGVYLGLPGTPGFQKRVHSLGCNQI